MDCAKCVPQNAGNKTEPVTITNLINKMENLEKLTKEMAMKEVADNQDMKYLILRNCLPEGRSHNEFQWNLEIDGITKAPDWNSVPECGQGLHGWLWGEGNAYSSNYNNSSVWLVCEIDKYVVIDSGKVKFPEAKTLFVGNMMEAASWLYNKLPEYGQLQCKMIIGLA